MKKIFSYPVIAVVAGVGLILLIGWLVFNRQPISVSLAVPYASQAPEGDWSAPWDEACEETSALMIAGYYQGQATLEIPSVITQILAMVAWENQVLGKNKDTEATGIKALIDHLGFFEATIQRDPSLKRIQKELRAKRPVIILVNRYQLYGEPNLGDSYHVAVIIGYDEASGEFIIHDPAKSADTRYLYGTVMNSLHDFNPISKEADGQPTVLFTAPKN
ncbi:MAG: C39 family peptidase [Candidatus Komeilibacteria bacterium]|nr:C39 family peptidase [Candidatus Komeilibacteria bacterium]